MEHKLHVGLITAAAFLLLVACNHTSASEENVVKSLKQFFRTDKVTVNHGADADDKSLKTVEYEVSLNEQTTVDDTKPDLLSSLCAWNVNLQTMPAQKRKYPVLVVKINTEDGLFKYSTETRYPFALLDSLQPVMDIFDTVVQAFTSGSYSSLYAHLSDTLKNASGTPGNLEQSFTEADKKFGVAKAVTLEGFRFIRRPGMPDSFMFFINIKRPSGTNSARLIIAQRSRDILSLTD
jgi:hypothetical protein